MAGDLLPKDVLVDILRRVAPRDLAMSRCVCKPWCTIIDTHHLLRVDLLPHSVGGIFINFHDLYLSEFFSRPSIGPTVSGNFNYLPHTSIVTDHCNGLLLLHGYAHELSTQYFVVNPATQQWVQLPPHPIPNIGMDDVDLGMDLDYLYLVFDPTLSSHFEVLRIPNPSVICHRAELDPTVKGMEWPWSPCMFHVFSTRTKQWEERPFVRVEDVAGTLTNMGPGWPNFLHNAVYWRGVLYVHCKNNFVMRISLSDAKYQIINPPKAEDTDSNLYLGRSQKGIYCAFFQNPHLIYILDESHGEMKWVVKHHIRSMAGLVFQQTGGPWILQDNNYHSYEDLDEYGHDNSDATEEQKFEWDSDNDNVIDTNIRKYSGPYGEITFLGFHPYKEIVFLSDRTTRGVAYHLTSGKVQDLGNLCPKYYGTGMGIEPFVEESFIYTPWKGELTEDLN